MDPLLNDWHQLENEVLFLRDTYDFVRLVNPLLKKTIDVSSREEMPCKTNCFNFNQRYSCGACFSENTILSKRSQVKFEYRFDKLFLVVSKIIFVDEKWLALELIKELKSVDKLLALARVEKDLFNDYIEEFNGIMYQDELTHIQNRRYFEKYFPLTLKKAVINRCDIGLALIDIDDFKTVNDTYGHDIGDEVLKEVAMLIRQNVRSASDDYVVRLGGDEFLIAIYRIGENDFINKLKRIKNVIADKKMHRNINVTISIGAVMLSQLEKQSQKELLKTADKALYQSKEKGKNCITYMPLKS